MIVRTNDWMVLLLDGWLWQFVLLLFFHLHVLCWAIFLCGRASKSWMEVDGHDNSNMGTVLNFVCRRCLDTLSLARERGVSMYGRYL